MFGAELTAMLGSIAVAIAVPLTPVSVEYGHDAEGVANATAHVVSSIAAFTRWPAAQRTLRLCVVGQAEHGGSLDAIGQIAGKVTTTVRATAENASSAGCDILYLGRMGAEALRGQVASAREQRVLTIAETDPHCRSGAMFCLVHLEDGLTFELNVDAISRSGLRVDPRVMRIGRSRTS